MRLEKLTHMVVTHLSPKRIASLKEVLAQRAKRRPAAPLELILSNPALQLLRTTLGRGIGTGPAAMTGVVDSTGCRWVSALT